VRANSLNNISVSRGSEVDPGRGNGRCGGGGGGGGGEAGGGCGGGGVSAFSTRVSSGEHTTAVEVSTGCWLVGGGGAGCFAWPKKKKKKTEDEDDNGCR